MEWNEKLEEIIEYVENHLQRMQEPIDNKEIAKLASCSFDFFQKVFSYMNGITFFEYVRGRKMTLAGYDLKSTKETVVAISYKYGYDSPTSFTKAFQQFHGCTPRQARNNEYQLQVLPKMQVALKQKYTWKLEQKKSLRLLGKGISIEDNGVSMQEQILSFWSVCQKDGTFMQLMQLDTNTPQGMFGIFTNEGTGMEYLIMVISNQEIPEGCKEYHLPESTWAIFDCLGSIPTSIQNGWKYLEEEWLVKYPFLHAKAPEMEWYSNGNMYSSDYVSQIWIPIIEKGE